ncbi:MAG: hypothetical protein ABW128_08470, partial [Rhizorhabdus sp.]
IYGICVSLRETPTGIARNIASYGIPYLLSFHVLSRVRIERPELVLRLLVLAAAGAGLLCIFETVRHWPLYAGVMGVKNELWTIDAPRVWLERGGIARAYGPFSHPLTGGAMLGLAAVGAWGLWLSRQRPAPVLLLGIAIMIGLASTLSRSGLVAVAVGIMTFQMLRGRYLLALLVPLVGFVTIFALPILGGGDAQSSTNYRLELITGIPRALGDRVWLGYREAIPEGLLDKFIQGQGIVDLVNAYIAIIVEGGIISLIPFVLFLFSAYTHYRAIRRLNPDKEQLLLAQTLISIQTAIIVALALLSSWVAPMQFSFFTVAMLIALRYDIARPRRAAASPVTPLAVEPAVDAGGERLPSLR